MINKVVSIHGLDAKIEALQTEILNQYPKPKEISTVFPDPDGVDTNILSIMIAEKMTSEDIKELTKLITKLIDRMAIAVKVSYDSEYGFILDFRAENFILGKTCGKVVKLKLDEILFQKCTYQQLLETSVIAVLLYSLVQKEVA